MTHAIFEIRPNDWVIHIACSHFKHVTHGKIRLSSIACVQTSVGGRRECFSIASEMRKERLEERYGEQIPSEDYERLERQFLQAFADFLQLNRGTGFRLLHWALDYGDAGFELLMTRANDLEVQLDVGFFERLRLRDFYVNVVNVGKSQSHLYCFLIENAPHETDILPGSQEADKVVTGEYSLIAASCVGKAAGLAYVVANGVRRSQVPVVCAVEKNSRVVGLERALSMASNSVTVLTPILRLFV